MSPPSARLQTKPVITCLKTFLISYSLIFWFTGVILLAVGVWGKVNLEFDLLLNSDKSTNAPYVLIGTGASIIIFGLFGCFATCRGSPWMLKLLLECRDYAMFLTLVFLAELVAGISGFIFRHEVILFFFYLYIQITSNITYLWANTDYFKTEGIPKSCCNKTAGGNCPSAELKDLNKAALVVYQRGCFSLMTATLEANLGIIAGISFGIAFFQLIGIFLACCLSRYITNNQYELV
uniref:Tetraspanin 7 n=1 Tax=Sinocyclocheilus rhinocerous TaxID=307959 RepID=A0A673M967_9TELE